MPIVSVTMFEGRDEETKARLTRELAAVVAEITVNSIADVHVLIEEKPRDSWGRGLVLASRRNGGAPRDCTRAEYAGVSRIKYDPATEDAYLALRRDVINPGMAGEPGFIDSLLLRRHDREHEYTLVNRWLSREDATNYANGPVHDELKRQALEILPEPLQSIGADVVHLDPPAQR